MVVSIKEDFIKNTLGETNIKIWTWKTQDRNFIMAELVQASLEGMLTELEQMQRLELFSSDEVKEVIKRRQRFEYKLQKRQKKKEDILTYIQYECALLELIEIRREKNKYGNSSEMVFKTI